MAEPHPRKLRVTFLVPAQDATSGGAMAILQFARLCAATMQVRVGVELHKPLPVHGLDTFHAGPLANSELPPADVVALPVESRRVGGGFPEGTGTPVLLFQGLGTVDDDLVVPNLRFGHPALVTSSWLLDEAVDHGARAALVQLGIDRQIFGMGLPPVRRQLAVAMTTSPVPWKGTSDGFAALKLVRAAVPDLGIRLLGHTPPPEELSDARFIRQARPEEVASAMKECAVFVCASWQEGFGLPGAEAMVCGAALATTDTRGSRDYADDGITALVSPPQKPEALAENIIKLLEDLELRERLVAAAKYNIDVVCPDWPDLQGPFTATFGSLVRGSPRHRHRSSAASSRYPHRVPDEALPKVRVQIVLYESELAQVWRALRGVDAASLHSLSSGLASRFELAIGDSSQRPVLQETDRQAMQDSCEAISAVSYDWFDANLGSAGGQNRLATNSESDLIMILNPDAYPSPVAMSELIVALAAPDVGIAEARQVPLEHPKDYNLTTGETSWASGACSMVRSMLFHQLSGFDTAFFFLHCDDVDFSWRVRSAGFRIVHVPSASVFHDKRPELFDAWPAPPSEQYYSVLGRLMLATRWGRPDIVTETLDYVETHGSQPAREAAVEFQARCRTGRVPERFEQLEAAQFVDGEYARHRF